MPAAIDLVVRLIEISGAENHIAFTVAFEAGAGDGIEYPICTIAIVSIVTAALHLHVVKILWIHLGSYIAGDIRIRNRYAINQPTVLMSAADVEHVMNHVRSGDVVRDEGQAVGSVGARRELNILAAQRGCGRHAIGGGADRFSRDDGSLGHAGQGQLEMNHRAAVGPHS